MSTNDESDTLEYRYFSSGQLNMNFMVLQDILSAQIHRDIFNLFVFRSMRIDPGNSIDEAVELHVHQILEPI